MEPRYRTGKIKREHSILDGLLPLLERIASEPDVDAVIPGRIRVTRARVPRLTLRLQARTLTGFKIGARLSSLAQEVFVVTREADLVESALQERRILERR